MIDCKETKNFLREWARMCSSAKPGCFKCLIHMTAACKHLSCGEFITQFPDSAIDLIQNWSNKHPLKTCYDDFCEKFPKISKLDKKNFYFTYCKADFYGEEIPCQYIGEGAGACEKCWRTPLDEVTNGNE